MTKNLEKQELKEHEEKYINIFKNYMKEAHDIKNIDDIKKERIYKYINEAKNAKNGNDYSNSWKKIILFALVSYYKQKGDLDASEYISTKAKEMNKIIEKEEIEQKQTEKEKENYLNIFELRNIAEKYKNYKHIDEMYVYLLLSCICQDQEPLRPQIYSDSIYVDKLEDIKDDGNNYIYISKRGKIGCFYISGDKVNKHNDFIDNKRIRLNKIFLSIVHKSFKDYPRKKLFDFDVKYPNDKLLDIFQKATGNKFNFQMARSSFSNYKHMENPDMSYAQKKTLAMNMRHSKNTHEKNYLKHSLTITDKPLNDVKKELDEKYKKLMETEEDLNKKIKELNDNKINIKKYEMQKCEIKYENEDEKKRIVLFLQQVQATKEKYDEYLKDINEILEKFNNEKKKQEDKINEIIKNFDKYKFVKEDDELFKGSLLLEELKKSKLDEKYKKIQNIITKIGEKKNYNEINKKLLKIINEKVKETIVLEKDNDELSQEFKKRRRDIIYHANKNMEKKPDENKKEYKEKKGVISSANMAKYKIIFNEITGKYE
jgi:hypothetical protein